MMPAPPILGRISGADETFVLFMDPDHPGFCGHFPGNPVLPGVLQVDLAIRLGREAYGPLGAFTALERIKFLEPIRPGETLELHLVLVTDPVEPGLRFHYLGQSGRKSSGLIRFLAP
jgi:3-hydroxymyristoyl/3-hydroxydecanoyl-(acyl carrier protein) dehydratase